MAGSLDRVATALRVVGSPERLRILRAVARKGPLSPSGYVGASGATGTLREAAYHFRNLREAGVLALDEVRATAGTAQHFYVLSPVGRVIASALTRLEKAAAEPPASP